VALELIHFVTAVELIPALLMSKHSKNNTSRNIFTYGEKKMLQGLYGTIRLTLPQDAQKPCDFCGLCLKRALDPVACQEGHLFCRDCILTHLSHQRNDLAREVEIRR
jgi:nitric oxide synthase-interacting protein